MKEKQSKTNVQAPGELALSGRVRVTLTSLLLVCHGHFPVFAYLSLQFALQCNKTVPRVSYNAHLSRSLSDSDRSNKVRILLPLVQVIRLTRTQDTYISSGCKQCCRQSRQFERPDIHIFAVGRRCTTIRREYTSRCLRLIRASRTLRNGRSKQGQPLTLRPEDSVRGEFSA